MIDKLKWAFIALVSLFLGILAFLYGKQTLSVLRWKVREHNAKGRILNTEIKAAEDKAAAEENEAQAQMFAERANTLKIDRDNLEKERLRLVAETGDLEEMSDADLAESDNDRRARARTGSSAG
jgi:hypothetical protein